MMQTDTIQLSPACPQDMPQMIALLDDLFGIEQDFAANAAKQEAGLQQLLASPHTACILVARNAEQTVIGMVTAQLVISTAEGGYSAWIEDMVIAQAYRRHGIGKRLLQGILDWARAQGASRAQLLVDVDNAPAVAYYDHLGWSSSRMGMRRILL